MEIAYLRIHILEHSDFERILTACQAIKNSVGCYERVLQRKRNATQKTIERVQDIRTYES